MHSNLKSETQEINNKFVLKRFKNKDKLLLNSKFYKII